LKKINFNFDLKRKKKIIKMKRVTKFEILSLYRRILRKGDKQIKFSNKEYFRKKIRKEFEMVSTSIGKEDYFQQQNVDDGDDNDNEGMNTNINKEILKRKMFEKGVEFLNKDLGGVI
jgi:hypothetical protein